MRKKAMAVATSVLLSGGLAMAAERPSANPLSGSIELDGRLDDAAWAQATWRAIPYLSKSQQTATRTAPSVETRFAVLTGPDAIYVGMRCEEPLMNKLAAGPLPRNGTVWERDCIEIFLDPQGRGMEYHQFMVSAGNGQFNGYSMEAGNISDSEFDAVWQSAVARAADHWSVEVRLPMTVFYKSFSSQFRDVWKVNICRERKAVRENSTWSRLEVANFHSPQYFNVMGGLPVKGAAYDVHLTGLAVQAFGKPGAWKADLRFQTEATAATAGDYRLSVWLDETALATDRPVTVARESGEVRLTDVAIPAVGRQVFKATLTKDGVVRAERYFKVRIDSEPLRVTLTKPFYADCVFPGQTLAAIEGRAAMNLPAGDLEGATLRTTFAGPGLPGPAPREWPIANGGAAFSFPVPELAVGDYTLDCRVVRQGSELAAATVAVRRLPPPPKGICVYIDEHLNLVVDGTPRILRSWYAPEYLVSQALQDRIRYPADCPFVNTAHFDISMEGERLLPGSRKAMEQDAEPSAEMYAAMLKVIERARGSKLLCYYLCDEPEFRNISPVYLEHQYRFIKKHDPYRPVRIGTTQPAKFTRCADIMSTHPYIGPYVDDRGVRKLGRTLKSTYARRVQEILEAGAGRILPWTTPQAFSYGTASRNAVYPNFAEYRAMVFTSLAAGARGFKPFIRFDYYNSLDLHYGVDFCFEVIAGMEPFLFAHEQPLDLRVKAPDDGVIAWAKRADGEVMLVAVNMLDRPLGAAIESPELGPVRRLFGFHQAGEFAVENGCVKLAFVPYGVWVLGSAKWDGAGSGLEQVLEKLEAAKAALAKPGNLLFGTHRDVVATFDPRTSRWGGGWGNSRLDLGERLTDGYADCLAFTSGQEGLPVWLELAFAKEPIAFRTVKVYTATIADADLFVRTPGGEDWSKLAEIRGNTNWAGCISFTAPAPVTAAGFRVVARKTRMGKSGPLKAEIYEIEMYR
ncbi:MAG: hypothetical protein JXR37_14165 [Kiritimatiellae bacterium]|nr:hypothetical protein [Kiritimatiellia bacterium]